MPSYIVTCKENATDEEVAEAMQRAKDQGGKITHEFKLVKGFSVEFAADAITTLESDKNVEKVELDKVMTTQ